jgi:hypothetical protein
LWVRIARVAETEETEARDEEERRKIAGHKWNQDSQEPIEDTNKCRFF